MFLFKYVLFIIMYKMSGHVKVSLKKNNKENHAEFMKKKRRTWSEDEKKRTGNSTAYA